MRKRTGCLFAMFLITLPLLFGPGRIEAQQMPPGSFCTAEKTGQLRADLLARPCWLKVKQGREGNELSWGTQGDAFDFFEVLRRTGKYGEWERLGFTKEQTFLDREAEKGYSYYYTVRSAKSIGEFQPEYLQDGIYAGSAVLGEQKAAEAESSEELKVLIVGNSMTAHYGTSAVELIRRIAAYNGDAMSINGLTIDNALLYDWAYGAYSGYLADALKNAQYDVIVLQEESWTTCTDLDTYEYYVDCMTDVLKQYGQEDARLILYAVNGCVHKPGMSYENYERNMLINISLAADRIREEGNFFDVSVAKAGELHLEARNATPWMSFLSYDGNHPDYYGYYLSAMRLYSAIRGRPVEIVDQEMMQYVSLSNMQMEISQNEADLKVGDTLRLEAETPDGSRIFWYSYNPETAAVSEDGVVQVVGEGTAAILAESDTGLQQICIIEAAKHESGGGYKGDKYTARQSIY